MDLGTALMNVMLESNRQTLAADGKQPKTLTCGCCDFGCDCALHAKDRKAHACWWHQLEQPGGTVTGLMGMVDKIGGAQ